MPPPNDPALREDWKRRVGLAMKRRLADPAIRAVHVKRMQEAVHSQEADAKRAETLRDAWQEESYHQWRAERMRQPEMVERARQAKLRYWQDASRRAAHAQLMKGVMSDPALQDKTREGVTAWWRSEENRARRAEQLRDPTRRQKQAEAMRALFADPTYKEQWLATIDIEGRRQRFRERAKSPEFQRRRTEALAEKLRPSRLELKVRGALEAISVAYVPQKPLGPYIVDIYLPAYKTVVECDGAYWHATPQAKAYDARRDGWMAHHGYRVYRLSEQDIKADARGAVMTVLDALER